MDARDHPTTADYAAHQAYELLARVDALEQRLQALEGRLKVVDTNSGRLLTLLERLAKAQSAMVGEVKDKVSEIRASLPHTPVTINQ